jgi:peptidoglycan hydrolase CwlO-like protein
LKVCSRCGSNINDSVYCNTIVDNHNIIPDYFRQKTGFLICPECGKKITRKFSKNQGQIDALVIEITGIENGLKKMLDNLRERIEKLRNERAELLKEINDLKIIGQNKANSLEKDINSLKEEIGSLREILEER